MVRSLLAVPLKLHERRLELDQLVTDVLHLVECAERRHAVAVVAIQAKVGNRQCAGLRIARGKALLGARDRSHHVPRISEAGPTLRRERLDDPGAHSPGRLQPRLLHARQEDAVERAVVEVVKTESVLQAKAARQALVRLTEHLEHLVLVADEHDGDVLAGCAVH
eukprot:scaffold320393_cov28-Tisochrysis_lutea.AAC.8